MNLKLSKYIHFAKNENLIIGYNFLKRSIIQVENPSFVESFIKLNGVYSFNDIKESLLIDNEEIDYLVRTGFLIDSNIDEISEIKFKYRRSLFNGNSLSLIVLLTLKCNFDCPYCYEKKVNTRMNKGTKDNLIKWIESVMPDKRILHIAWFGGEPLLEKKSIYELTDQINSLSKKLDFKYFSSITTNGYFLNQDFINRIEYLGIKHVQVTFDGDKYFHNKSRFLANGKGSFDILVKNVIQLVSVKQDVGSVSIRVNCTDENFESISDLLKSFPLEIRSKITIFFRWVYESKAKCFKDFSSEKKGDFPYLNLSKLYREAELLGWITENPNSIIKFNYCEVDFLDSYSIDPSGNLFLCGHSMEPEDSIGNVNSRNVINSKKNDFISKWYSQEPFTDTVCMECKLLPLCLGGCRKQRLEGKRGCIEENKSLDTYLIDLFNENNQRMTI
jgi:uncharacterized protein